VARYSEQRTGEQSELLLWTLDDDVTMSLIRMLTRGLQFFEQSELLRRMDVVVVAVVFVVDVVVVVVVVVVVDVVVVVPGMFGFVPQPSRASESHESVSHGSSSLATISKQEEFVKSATG